MDIKERLDQDIKKEFGRFLLIALGFSAGSLIIFYFFPPKVAPVALIALLTVTILAIKKCVKITVDNTMRLREALQRQNAITRERKDT